MIVIGEITPGQVWMSLESRRRFTITRVEVEAGQAYVYGQRYEGRKPMPIKIKADNMTPRINRYRLVKDI